MYGVSLFASRRHFSALSSFTNENVQLDTNLTPRLYELSCDLTQIEFILRNNHSNEIYNFFNIALAYLITCSDAMEIILYCLYFSVPEFLFCNFCLRLPKTNAHILQIIDI